MAGYAKFVVAKYNNHILTFWLGEVCSHIAALLFKIDAA